ncbi:hypothetical protein V1509DRAFT_637724 [Lipomyces kononenkoae]
MTEPNEFASETVAEMVTQFQAVVNQQNEEIQRLHEMVLQASRRTNGAGSGEALVKGKIREPEPLAMYILIDRL